MAPAVFVHRDHRALLIWAVAAVWDGALLLAVVFIVLFRPDHVPLWGPLVLLVFPAIPGLLLTQKAMDSPCIDVGRTLEGFTVRWRLPHRKWEATLERQEIESASVQMVRDETEGSVNWHVRLRDIDGEGVTLASGASKEDCARALARLREAVEKARLA
jgi:hypothetical protein